MFLAERLVVPVDEWRAEGAEDDTDGNGDKHQTGVARGPSLSTLVYNGISSNQQSQMKT